MSTNKIKASTTEIKVEPTYQVKTYEKLDRSEGNAYRESRGRGYNRFRENNQTSDSRRQRIDS